MRTGLSSSMGPWRSSCWPPLVIVVLIPSRPRSTSALPTTHWSLRWYCEVFITPASSNSFLLSLRLALLSAFVATGAHLPRSSTRSSASSSPGRKTLDGLFMSSFSCLRWCFGIAMLQFLNLHGLTTAFGPGRGAHRDHRAFCGARDHGGTPRGAAIELEWAAIDLGAGRLGTIWHITLPLAGRGVLAGLFPFCLHHLVRRSDHDHPSPGHVPELPVAVLNI